MSLFKKKQRQRRRVDPSVSMRVNRATPSKRKEDNVAKKHRKNFKRKQVLIRWSVVVVALIIGSAVIAKNIRITDVNIAAEQKNYTETVENYLSRNPFARNKLFISSQAIVDDLVLKHPQVENAEVVVPIFGNEMSVTVIERQAQLVLRTSDDEYFLVDKSGFAYGKYDLASKNDKTVVLTDDTRVEYDISQNSLIPSALVEFIEDTNSILRNSKFYSRQSFAYRITDEARVIYVKPSGVKYEIKMQLDEPLGGQAETLFSALEYYENKRITPQKYVDVRVNGTVYYR